MGRVDMEMDFFSQLLLLTSNSFEGCLLPSGCMSVRHDVGTGSCQSHRASDAAEPERDGLVKRSHAHTHTLTATPAALLVCTPVTATL